MADTVRSISSLQSLLADNSSGAISPQDLRDFLVSALGEYGEIYRSAGGGGVTLVAIGTTPVKLTVFDSDGPSAGAVTPSHSNDRITVGTSGTYQVSIHGYAADASTAANLRLILYRNGVSTSKDQASWVAAATQYATISFTTLLDMTANDYLEIYASTSGSHTFTLVGFFLSVRRIK